MPKKQKERKGKKAHTKHKLKPKSKQYMIDGTAVKKNRFCPKCGSGVFMAEHANRFACGKCSFTEWKNRQSEEKSG